MENMRGRKRGISKAGTRILLYNCQLLTNSNIGHETGASPEPEVRNQISKEQNMQSHFQVDQ